MKFAQFRPLHDFGPRQDDRDLSLGAVLPVIEEKLVVMYLHDSETRQHVRLELELQEVAWLAKALQAAFDGRTSYP